MVDTQLSDTRVQSTRNVGEMSNPRESSTRTVEIANLVTHEIRREGPYRSGETMNSIWCITGGSEGPPYKTDMYQWKRISGRLEPLEKGRGAKREDINKEGKTRKMKMDTHNAALCLSVGLSLSSDIGHRA